MEMIIHMKKILFLHSEMERWYMSVAFRSGFWSLDESMVLKMLPFTVYVILAP